MITIQPALAGWVLVWLLRALEHPIQDDPSSTHSQESHLPPSLTSSSAARSGHPRQNSGSSGSSKTNTNNSSSNAAASVHATSRSLLPAASADTASLSDVTTTATATAPSTLSLGSGGPTNTTPSTTFQRSAPAASLSVALCRSVVLKYIYLTYLFLLQILLAPSVAVQTFLRRRRQPGSSNSSVSSHSSKSRTGVQESGDEAMMGSGEEGVGAVGQKFLQQYTLDNHLGHYSNSRNSGVGSSSSSSIHNNNNNGNSMLRRSSRFKSRSDLEEIAQSSTSSTLATGFSDEAMVVSSVSSPGSRRSSSGPAVAPSRPSFSSSSLAAPGYGTDSMAEDASGDNSASGRGNKSVRLRQRLGRPMSGLGVAGGHGHGAGMGRKKTLVLDLDETLIHSTSRGSRSQGYMVEVLVDRHACLYYVYKRPHVDYFLKKVSEWYKLVIFTASMAEYADPVIDWLDQSRTLFDRRYFRQACFFQNGSYLKDLTVIDPDLSSVCLLDNSPLSYSLNKENGIPIDSWIDNPNDEALLDLLPFLDALRFTEDVRSVLSLRTV
ncbi:unnamed protein product [Mortierella alpina]